MGVGPDMNCFQWQNLASDYLDGALMGALKREADEHLEECEDCGDRQKHYRILVSAISNQPRSVLPIPIRRAPFSATFAIRDAMRRQSIRSRWEAVPWYLRTALEGTSIVFLIIFAISLGPRVRALYERNIEHRLAAFNESFRLAEFSDDLEAVQDEPSYGGAPATIALSRGIPAESLDGVPAAETEEFSGETEEETTVVESHASSAGNAAIKVGNSEVWRFNYKTDSPHELRARVIQALKALNFDLTTAAATGIEAPGGIQFDLLVSQAQVVALKQELEKIAPVPAAAIPQGPKYVETSANLHPVTLTESFAWYRSRSKRALPKGKARVVIWLSQM